MKRKMLKQVNVVRDMAQRLEELKGMSRILQQEIENAPGGKLHIVNSKGRVQYYKREAGAEKSGTYLSKKGNPVLRGLVQKLYDVRALKAIEGEMRCLERGLRAFRQSPTEIQDVYESFPEEARKYITPVDLSDSTYALAWQAVPFQGKGVAEDQPNFMTARGEKVRSKSEVNIANALDKMGVPYRYEAPLKLKGGVTIYPDFTVLDVKNRKVMYWEHRGMMDDREYARHAVERIRDYAQNDLHVGRDVIITEETQVAPLGTAEIKKVVEAYFG